MGALIDRMIDLQAFGIAGCIIIVFVFIKYLKVKDKHQREEIAAIGANCHTHTTALAKNYDRLVDSLGTVIEKNTDAFGEVKQMLGEFKGVLSRMNGK